MRPQFKKIAKWILALIGVLIVAFIIFIFVYPSESPRSVDSKRIANVRQISSVLELYKHENGSYPNNLEQLVPIYVNALPIQPLNPTKYCLPEQIPYKYTLLPDDEYKIDFCLGDEKNKRKYESGYKDGMNVIFSDRSSQ